jgi:transcriptional regulator PpsR
MEPAAAARLLADTADLVIVLDGDDFIQDVTDQLSDSTGLDTAAWCGLPFDRVLDEKSRPTARRMLSDARDRKANGRVDLRHNLAGGHSLPVQYAARALGDDRAIVLAGRDMRPIDALRMRLAESDILIETRRRALAESEDRYRALFELTGDAVLILSASDQTILDGNERLAAQFGVDRRALAGRPVTDFFDASAQLRIRSRLRGVLASGRADEFVVERGGLRLSMNAHPFPAEGGDLLIMRVVPVTREPDGDASVDAAIETLIRDATQAVLLTDQQGRVTWVNDTFARLARLPSGVATTGGQLSDLVDTGIAEDRLLDDLADRHRVDLRGAIFHGAASETTAVDISAVAMPNASPPGYGFVLREIADHTRTLRQAGAFPSGMETLAGMVGQVPMKDLVRETTDVIEKMCIESALSLTGNNRAAAARVLGLSRQALYLKLERYGITDD